MIPVGLTLLLYVFLKFVLLIGYVPTPSMEPTLPEKSFIFGTRIFRELKTGDIVVFEKDGVLLVKRIAACPGDEVDLSQINYMTTAPIPVWDNPVITVPEDIFLFWVIIPRTHGIPATGKTHLLSKKTPAKSRGFLRQ